MTHMKCWFRKCRLCVIISFCIVIGGCDLGLTESDNYYLSFEKVDDIVIEKYGVPATKALQRNSERPLNYRLVRPFYTLYIDHYERKYNHPQYTLRAVSNDGEELTIDYLIPQEKWPIGQDGYTNTIYCYRFNYREEQFMNTGKTRILKWPHLNRSLDCRGGAQNGPLNRIDLALFDSNGALVAEERLPVTHVKNGVYQTYDY